MPARRKRRAFSVSIYCRHEGSVLLVQHKRLRLWVPVGGEMLLGETPLEAAERELWEGAGIEHPIFPHIHSVLGAPPGLLLYEEHEVSRKGTHMNFAFIAEVPYKNVRSNGTFGASVWVTSLAELPEGTPPSVQDAMPYALTAGVT